MSSCTGCKKSVRQSEKIICTRSNCAKTYHYLCVGLTSESAKKISSWTCPYCISKQPKAGDNTNTPLKHTSEENSPVSSHLQESSEFRTGILNSLKDELQVLMRKAVKSELSSLKAQISTMETTLNYISTQYDDLMKNLASTTAELKCLKEENARLRSDADANTRRIKQLEEEFARQQQWSRLQNIEITGVPEDKDENTVEIVVKLAEKLGVTMDSSEVEFAHRVQPRKPNSSIIHRSIIARFRHRSTKDSIVIASRKHRGIKLTDIGMVHKTSNDNARNNIYINEHLTPYNRDLFKQCKIKTKEFNFKFIWTKNCRIYVRRNETSPPIPIITTADLIKIV